MPRKLEAQFAGRYLMPSVLMTSTMKSEPGTPLMRDCSPLPSPGLPVSAAAICALGGSADGARGASVCATSADWASAAAGATAAAAAMPVRNLRRSGLEIESLRAMTASSNSAMVKPSAFGAGRTLLGQSAVEPAVTDRAAQSYPWTARHPAVFPSMEFGVFDHLDKNDRPLARYYAERLELAEAYERAGFYAYHVA